MFTSCTLQLQKKWIILRNHKDTATVEVLPNHLTFHAPDCYEELGTLAQQNPPIREKHHQDALWQAINDGTVDIVASDHAPHTLEKNLGLTQTRQVAHQVYKHYFP